MSDHFVGIDVGGTKIAVAGLAAGELSESNLLHTELEDQERLVDQIADAIEEARTPDTRAVGIGVPSLVEFATGRIASSVNIPLQDVPLRELLSERCDIPVYVDNDASCAALAEAFDDGRLTCPHLVLFTVGTGVGGGLVLNGRLHPGPTGNAGHIGHISVELDGDPCACGSRGCVERIASGPNIARRALANGWQPGPDGDTSAAAVAEAARIGDPVAVASFERAAQALAAGIAATATLVEIDVAVIGGGVGKAGDVLFTPLRAALKTYATLSFVQRLEIVPAQMGTDAGLVGAAAAALTRRADDTAEASV